MAVSLTLLAPNPFTSYATRGQTFVSDGNGIIANVVPGGTAIQDLIASGCVPISANPYSNFRNILDGGDFTVNPWQRNIPGLASAGVIASAITSTPTYFADRFFAVGGASSSILMANVADTSMAGFNTSLLMTRSSGNANTAVLNFGQVVETPDSIKCQGQLMTLSFYARTAANYSGGALSVAFIFGTGNNQSAANMVAGSWTNQANVSLTALQAGFAAGAQVLTPTMTRYAFQGVVPVGATQLGFLATWTPAGTAGTTDGIYYNGLQLECGGLSAFEHRDIQVELEICQRYAWVIAEPAAGVTVATGQAASTTVANYYIATPVQMRSAPNLTSPAPAFGSFKNLSGVTSTALTALAGGTTHTVNTLGVNGTAASGLVAAQGALLQGGGGNGYIVASSDF